MTESELGPEHKEIDMELRNFSIVLLGAPTSGKTTFTTYLSETLHLPILTGSRVVLPEFLPTDGNLVEDSIFVDSLEKYLSSEPPTGHIFDGIPRTPLQAGIISKWSKKQGFPIHVINLDIAEEEVLARSSNREVCPTCQESYHPKVKPAKTPHKCDIDDKDLIKRVDDDPEIIKKRLAKFNDERDSILNIFNSYHFSIHTVDSNVPISEASRKVFEELSFAFEDPELPKKYFQLKDICVKERVDFMLISGACGYIYRGRRPLKDLDILVPTLDGLNKISRVSDIQIEPINSSYANSQFLNFSPGVELVTDLSVKYPENGQDKLIQFDFPDLDKDTRTVRFFGEDVKIMSPEWLIVFKLCLGRSGRDDFGHNKNDFADAYDITVSQPVDYEKISAIAKKIGAEERVNKGLKILRYSSG